MELGQVKIPILEHFKFFDKKQVLKGKNISVRLSEFIQHKKTSNFDLHK